MLEPDLTHQCIDLMKSLPQRETREAQVDGKSKLLILSWPQHSSIRTMIA